MLKTIKTNRVSQRLIWQYHRIGWRRLQFGLLALIMTVSIVIPTAQQALTNRRYRLNDDVVRLVGSTDRSLAAKLSYDTSADSWQFNKSALPVGDGGTVSADTLKSQIGGNGDKDDSLYALQLPVQGSKGVSYYDTNTNLSFSLTPQFDVGVGRAVNGQLVYPFQDGGKLVYTPKNNGLKEDVVLSRNIGDELQFSYGLKLPDSLQAKLLDDGSLGIYSPDPVLFNTNMSFGGDSDKAKVESARQTAAKDHLLFAVPPPIIKQTGDKLVKASAHFELDGSRLKVVASNMNSLTYPVTVDPSVVVTSATDFNAGNNESNIDFSTGGQIGRQLINGGDISSYSSTSVFPRTMTNGSATYYNGYAYAGGGYDGTNNQSATMYYASVSTGGSMGTWTSTTAMPVAVRSQQLYAYNGYIYAIGGGSNTPSSDVKAAVYYAPLNTNGTIGTWTATTSLSQKRALFAVSGGNGYIYVAGGTTNGSGDDTGIYTATVEYAKFKADGTLSNWTTTSSLTSAGGCSWGQVYNGVIYNIGNSGCGGLNVYARINTDGSVGSWTTFSGTYGSDAGAGGIIGGNLYGLPGYNGSTNLVGYLPLQSNGVPSANWITTTSNNAFSGDYTDMSTFIANGRLYQVGGYASTTSITTTYYTNFKSTGTMQAYATGGNTFTTTRRGARVIAAYNRLYVLGGENGSTPVATVYTATLGSDGTVGTFSATTSMPTAKAFFGATVHKNYITIAGGCTSAYASCTTAANATAVVSTVKINDNGTLGTWNNQTSLPAARYGNMTVGNNGYIYSIGGLNASTFATAIYYSAIDPSNGSIGTWSTATYSLAAGRAYMGANVYGDRMYIAGGCTAGALTCTTAQSDILYTGFGATGDLSANFTTNGTSFTNARGNTDITFNAGFAYIGGGRSNTTNYADTQYAPVNANGSLGTWTAGSSFTNARYGGTLVSFAGYLYEAGGYDGTTYYNDVQYVKLNNGGGGRIVGWQTDSDTIATNYRFFGVAVYDGYVYVAGGQEGGGISQRLAIAKLQANGSLGAWSSSISMPVNALRPSIFMQKGYMYLTSGYDDGTSAKTYYAKVKSDHTLGAFTITTAAIPYRDSVGYTGYKDYMYMLAGNGNTCNGGSYGVCDTVYYAASSTVGNITSWTAGPALPTRSAYGTAVAANGYLYYVSGLNDANNPVGKIYYAQINSDGSLGSWNTTASTPDYIIATPTVVNGYMYLTAAYVYPGSVSQIYRTAINANGTLGDWQRDTNELTTFADQNEGTSFTANGYLYNVSLSGATDYTALDTPQRSATYSKLLDLGANYNLSYVTYNGYLAQGVNDVKLSLANANDSILASPVSGYSLTADVPILCTVVHTRWVVERITLDDSANSVFPDTATNSTNLTDITLNYGSAHPPSEVRLRQGKYFFQEILQPYDNCQL